MQPNKVGKPFSWYNNEREVGLTRKEGEKPQSKVLFNVLRQINNHDNSFPWIEQEATESENIEEPEMDDTEEGILCNKMDEINPMRSRVRTTS